MDNRIEPSLEKDTIKDIIEALFQHMPKESEEETSTILPLSKHVRFYVLSLDFFAITCHSKFFSELH